MGERKEPKPTPRVVLMEFAAATSPLFAALSDEDRTALLTQLGRESVNEIDGPILILVPIAEASGGPKAVIEAMAKTRGRFRAIAYDAYDQGHEAIPPEQQKFELKPL